MKQFVMTWIGAFVSVLVVLSLVGPALADQPLWLRALVVSGMMVFIMQKVIGPFLNAVTDRIGRRSSAA